MQEIGETVEEEHNSDKPLPAPTNSIERYLAEISNYPLLSREEEFELAMEYKKNGNLESARKLVTSNLKFVVKIANEYKNYGLNLMDLIQEGNIGLMQAVKRFDPIKGYRLISYAVWWIRAYIQNYIIKNWSLVKIGTTQEQRKLFYKLRSTKHKIGIKDAMPSPENYKKLAEELGVSHESVIEMEKRIGSKDLSLDTEVEAESETTHIDLLLDEVSSQEEIITNAQEKEKLKGELDFALKSLNKRELTVIKNRILRDKPLTLKELGTRLNVSPERVRQIEGTALKKIKAFLKKSTVV